MKVFSQTSHVYIGFFFLNLKKKGLCLWIVRINAEEINGAWWSNQFKAATCNGSFISVWQINYWNRQSYWRLMLKTALGWLFLKTKTGIFRLMIKIALQRPFLTPWKQNRQYHLPILCSQKTVAVIVDRALGCMSAPQKTTVARPVYWKR